MRTFCIAVGMSLLAMGHGTATLAQDDARFSELQSRYFGCLGLLAPRTPYCEGFLDGATLGWELMQRNTPNWEAWPSDRVWNRNPIFNVSGFQSSPSWGNGQPTIRCFPTICGGPGTPGNVMLPGQTGYEAMFDGSPRAMPPLTIYDSGQLPVGVMMIPDGMDWQTLVDAIANATPDSAVVQDVPTDN